jgi:hypothetical protein
MLAPWSMQGSPDTIWIGMSQSGLVGVRGVVSENLHRVYPQPYLLISVEREI